MYVGAFGVGTIVAMTMFAAAVGVLGARSDDNPRLQRAMMTVAAALAIAVGGVWLIAPLT
jgi:sulfite exporter TauE/SafE